MCCCRTRRDDEADDAGGSVDGAGGAGCAAAGGGAGAGRQLHLHVDAGRRWIPARLPGGTGDAHADTDKDTNMDANSDYNRYVYDDAIAYVYRHLGAYRGAADADKHRYLNTLTIAADDAGPDAHPCCQYGNANAASFRRAH